MKTFIKNLFLLLALPSVLFLCQTLPAAVTFTVTPSAVSNTYIGTITLQIGGLTNTEKVVVQKFLDLNTNSVIDGTDWLVQQFTLQDGTNFVIGGVTNFNVPGDLNATAGQITATLNFHNGDFVQNIVGKYLYKLSSPSGHFAPITNLFSVTNFPYAQKFTGNVVSNGTSTTLPNAVVILFSRLGSGGNGPRNPQAGAVANNSGSYTIPVPAGTYMPMAVKSNYLGNFATAPVLTLASGATLTTNLTLTRATTSISGTNVDANNSSIRVPGVMVSAQSTSGLLAITFTDTNGNFNVRVTAGTWGIGADDLSLIVHGYVGLQNKTNINSGTTGNSLGYPKATALFYGSVKDNLGNPLPGIDVYANDNNNYLYESDGYTGTNGNYAVGVLGGLGTNDLWWLQVDSGDSIFTNYVFSQPAFLQNGGTNISAGQALLANFTALLATNHISGSLKDNSGNPIVGVNLWANAMINGEFYNNGSVGTDANGNYSLNVANGTWTVGVNNSPTVGTSLPGNYLCPANQLVVIANNNGTANFTAILATNHISGHVQQSNGNPIGGVGVWASATINSVGYSQYVDADGTGNYSLNVANGSWTVGLESSGGSDSLDTILGSGNYQPPDNQNVNIAGNNATNNFIIQPCGGVQILTTSLPDGQVDSYYDNWLDASSCSGTLNWWLNDPQDFPSSLNFDSDGEIYGFPDTAGTYNFSVHVDDGNGHSANQSLSLTIQAGANSTPSITSPLPGSTLTSSSATFQWISGTGVTEYFFYVGTSFGASDLYAQSQGLNLSVTVNGLPVNGSTLYVRLWWNTSAGWQYTDYTYTAYYAVGFPDFIVQSINLSPASPTAGQAFTATVVVKNQGTAAGIGGWLDCWSDSPSSQSCGAIGDGYVSIGTLAAGASVTNTINFTAPSSGAAWTFRAFIDSGCATTESNDSNNQTTLSYSSSYPPNLGYTKQGANMVFRWPTNFTGYTLQSTTNLGTAAVWSTVSPPPVVVNGQNAVTNPVSGTQEFYRLSQ